VAHPLAGSDGRVVLTYQTVHRNDKLVAIHGAPPGENDAERQQLFYRNCPVDQLQKSCTLGTHIITHNS
jgi:hypothetical protein